MANPLGGQSSGDFRETSGRVQLFYVVSRNTFGVLTPDAFTQANPPIVTNSANKSTTLAGITRVGVLGGTVAFTRYDYGNGFHGGPVQVASAYDARIKPLGIFLNDANGNAFENTPGVASSRGTYAHGTGSTLGVSLYETKNQIANSNAITYQPGDKVYASVNGLLTNNLADAYEYNVSGQNDVKFVTLMGVVKVAPDANNGLLVVDLRV
jgi:hypothetical protein